MLQSSGLGRVGTSAPGISRVAGSSQTVPKSAKNLLNHDKLRLLSLWSSGSAQLF
jgi:hypothetical protein